MTNIECHSGSRSHVFLTWVVYSIDVCSVCRPESLVLHSHAPRNFRTLCLVNPTYSLQLARGTHGGFPVPT